MANETTHCKNCGALIYESEQIDGYGLRCGCLKKQFIKLKKHIKKIEKKLEKQGRLF